MKKTLSIFLIVCMVVSISSIFPTVVNGATSWDFSIDTLTITGNGDMKNYSYIEPGWGKYWESIKNIVVEEGVTSIGDNAFAGLNYVESVSLPSTLKKIGDNAFNSLFNLPNISIPSSVTSIGNYAFMSCDLLKQIVLPDSVTQLGGGVFSGCDSLESVKLSENLTNIEGFLFSECPSLSAIQIPESVTHIGDAFKGCINLKNIFIPKNVIDISWQAFSECEELENINVDPNNINYVSVDGNLFDKQEGILITYAPGKTDKSYVIPSFVTRISDYAFETNNKLENVVIPGSVSIIPYNAFANLENLKFVMLRDGVKIIDSFAFSGCTNLQLIDIPNSVERIGSYAFLGCTNLKQIDIPDSVEQIGDNAFYECTNLKQIDLGNGVKRIGASAFSRCTNLKSIIIPPSLGGIGDEAFYNCVNLQQIYWNTDYCQSSYKNHIFGGDSFDEGNEKNQFEIIIGQNVAYVNSTPFIALGDKEIILNVPKSVSQIYDASYFPFIKEIRYHGSEDEWNSIYDAEYLKYEKIVYNYEPNSNEDSSGESNEPTPPFYFSNSLTNQDGEIITPDNIADVTKVKMTLSKLHNGDHTGTFLIAFYGADNSLVYANHKSATISEDIDEIEIDITDDVSSAYKVKAFAWKGVAGIHPVCHAVEENIIIE